MADAAAAVVQLFTRFAGSTVIIFRTGRVSDPIPLSFPAPNPLPVPITWGKEMQTRKHGAHEAHQLRNSGDVRGAVP